MNEKQVKFMKYHIKSMKVLPIIMSLLCWISLILIYIGFNPLILSALAGVSLIPLIIIYTASYALNFCETLRMHIHYVAISNLYYWLGTIFSFSLMSLHTFNLLLIIAGVFLFIILIKWLRNK